MPHAHGPSCHFCATAIRTNDAQSFYNYNPPVVFYCFVRVSRALLVHSLLQLVTSVPDRFVKRFGVALLQASGGGGGGRGGRSRSLLGPSAIPKLEALSATGILEHAVFSIVMVVMWSYQGLRIQPWWLSLPFFVAGDLVVMGLTMWASVFTRGTSDKATSRWLYVVVAEAIDAVFTVVLAILVFSINPYLYVDYVRVAWTAVVVIANVGALLLRDLFAQHDFLVDVLAEWCVGEAELARRHHMLENGRAGADGVAARKGGGGGGAGTGAGVSAAGATSPVSGSASRARAASGDDPAGSSDKPSGDAAAAAGAGSAGGKDGGAAAAAVAAAGERAEDSDDIDYDRYGAEYLQSTLDPVSMQLFGSPMRSHLGVLGVLAAVAVVQIVWMFLSVHWFWHALQLLPTGLTFILVLESYRDHEARVIARQFEEPMMEEQDA